MKQKKPEPESEEKSLYEWAEDRLSAYRVGEFLLWVKENHGVEAEEVMTESTYLQYEQNFLS